MKFNEKLVEMRKKKGISQEELGELINVTRQTISKWELGDTSPDLGKLKEISKVFDVSIDELINEKEKTEKVEEKVEEKLEENIISDDSKKYNNYDMNNDYKDNLKIEDKKINEKNNNNKIILIVISIVIVLLVIGIILKFVFIAKATKATTDIIKEGTEMVQDEGLIDKFFDNFFKVKDKIDEEDKIDKIEDEKWLEERNKEMDEIEDKFNKEYNEQVEKNDKEFNERVEQNENEMEEFQNEFNESYEKSKEEYEKTNKFINDKINGMK